MRHSVVLEANDGSTLLVRLALDLVEVLACRNSCLGADAVQVLLDFVVGGLLGVQEQVVALNLRLQVSDLAMAETLIDQRLRQLFPKLGCQGVGHREATEGIEDGRNVGLLETDVGVPCEAGLLELLRLVLLEHAAVQPEADLALREVEHDAHRALRRRQELLRDGVRL